MKPFLTFNYTFWYSFNENSNKTPMKCKCEVVTAIFYRTDNRRHRTPLLHVDLLLEVVSFLSIADLKNSINWASRSLWYYI